MYNRPFHLTPRAFSRIALLFSCVLSSLLIPAISRADALEDAVRALAGRVASTTLREPVVLVWLDSSSLPAAHTDALRGVFEAVLADRHFLLKKFVAGISVDRAPRISIRETPSRLVILAAIRDTETDQVWSADLLRSEVNLSGKTSSEPLVQKELLWKQGDAILAAVEFHDPDGSRSSAEHLLSILSQQSFATYHLTVDTWQRIKSIPIPASLRVPRDLQAGFLFFNASEAVFFISNQVCLARDSIHCESKKEQHPPGEFRMYPFDCQHVESVFRTGSGDWSGSDTLRVADNDPALSESSATRVDFPGPILAVSSSSGKNWETAVVFNISTGNYEVYRVSIAHGN